MKRRHLGRDRDHRRALYRNLVTELLRHERIMTTEAKARAVRPMAERIITLARKARLNPERALHARRQALAFVTDKTVVHDLFDDKVDRFLDRPGGYTRIVKYGPRRGDGAPMVILELVD
ncbi:MAG: 50S ribosomal protein L17 [Ardenticatenia bacterium]|nr:50S ribosomal protein L17 [Ardenticatenia bacterium]